MTNRALARLRNALFCSLLTLGLAACGDNGSGSPDSIPLVKTNLGVIKRDSGPTGSNSNSGSNTVTTPGSQGGVPPVASSPVPPANTTGTATLDWIPPTLNSDGSALTNLAGYTVYYGTASDKLTQSIKVTNPGLSAYTVSDLSSGTWYFAISAYSSDGTESALTAVVSTTI